MQRNFEPFPKGQTDSGDLYVAVPVDGTTSVSTTTLVGFGTPWKLAIPVSGGESVQLELLGNIWGSANSILWLGITRNGTCVVRDTCYTAGDGTRSNTGAITFIDVLPKPGICVYEVVAGQSGGGTITVQNPTPDLVIAGSPFRQNAPSQLSAKIVNVLSNT